MKRLVRRLRVLLFLIESSPGIVREHGGVMKLATWLLRALMSRGPGYALGELVTLAARQRRHDVSLYRRWQKLQATTQMSHALLPRSIETPVFVVSGDCVNDTIAGILAQWPDARVFVLSVGDTASFDTDPRIDQVSALNDSKVLATLRAGSTTFVTAIRSSCTLDCMWIDSVAQALANGADMAYSDVEKADGLPLFLPDYSPELIGQHTYLSFVAIHSEFLLLHLDPIAGLPLRAGIDVLAQAARKVVHLPLILGQINQRGVDLLPDVVFDRSAHIFSIIIPTRDQLELLQSCIESIYTHTANHQIEIVVIDNLSGSNTRDWLQAEECAGRIKVVYAPIKFNWSQLNNMGVAAASGDVLVFLNNDVEVISPDWLDRLGYFATRPGVGAVGALLLYGDGSIQHGGVVCGFGGFADNLYSGATLSEVADCCFVSPLSTRNVSAVTGACLVTRRATFDVLTGFDEGFEVAGDVDYCLRALELGERNVFDGQTRLCHFESKTRSGGLPVGDQACLGAVLGRAVPEGDPFFNRNLSLSSRFPLVGQS